MFRTIAADWRFIVPATVIWLAALAATAYEFILYRLASYRFDWINLVGLVAMVAGIAIRIVARRTLGRHFSYALRLREDHELVQDGIYRYVRHPAYTGDLIVKLGVTGVFSSLGGFLLMLMLVPCFLYRIKIEEEMLIQEFGDAYAAYVRASRKLIPGIY